MRDNQSFSGVSALSALVAGWTVIASLVFPTPTALWLAFGGGIVLLMLSLRALALHETTIEQVVRQLDMTGPGAVEIVLTASAVAVAVAVRLALIVLTAIQGVGNLRWWTFGLGAALTGVALAASIVHELSSERVRHELEVARTGVGELAPAGH